MWLRSNNITTSSKAKSFLVWCIYLGMWVEDRERPSLDYTVFFTQDHIPWIYTAPHTLEHTFRVESMRKPVRLLHQLPQPKKWQTLLNNGRTGTCVWLHVEEQNIICQTWQHHHPEDLAANQRCTRKMGGGLTPPPPRRYRKNVLHLRADV